MQRAQHGTWHRAGSQDILVHYLPQEEILAYFPLTLNRVFLLKENRTH